MESNKQKTLPLAFRLSMLINILPFYDYLPRWMWLLVSLNSQTNSIWEENSEAFLKCKPDYKPTKKLTDPNTFRNIIRNKSQYFKSFDVNESLIYLFLMIYLSKQDSSVISLIYRNHDSDTKYTLSIFNKDKLAEYIPASNCEHFTYEELFSCNTSSTIRFMKQIDKGILNKFALILKKSGDTYKFYKVISPFDSLLNKNQNDDAKLVENFNKCEDLECCCKNKILLIDSLDLSIYFNLKEISEFNVKYQKIINVSSFTSYFFDLILKNEKTKFILNKFKLSSDTCLKVENKCSIFTNHIRFISKDAVTPILLNYTKINLKGAIKGLVKLCNSECIFYELEALKGDKFNFTYNTCKNSIECKVLNKLQEFCINSNRLFILVDVCDIQSIDVLYPYDTSIISNITSSCNFILTHSCDCYNLSRLINNLKNIPRSIKLYIKDFYKIDQVYFDHQEIEFWKTVLEFNEIKMNDREGNQITILSFVGCVDLEDISNNCFEIKHALNMNIVCYKDLIRLLNK